MSINQSDTDSLIDDIKIHHSFEFKPQAFEGYKADSFTFAKAIKPTTERSALRWFGGEQTISEGFLKHLRKNFNVPQWAEGSILANQLLRSEKVFKNATQISWSESTFALGFASFLGELGAETQVRITPNGPKVEVLTGMWLLSNGLPFVITGELWRDNKSGSNFIYWHIDALSNTRHLHLKPHPSIQYFLPLLFQSAAFLSESSNPDTLAITPTRKQIFGVDDDSLMPALTFQLEKDYYHAVFILNEDGEPELQFEWTAETVRYGYVFKEIDDISTIEIAIAVTTTALTKVAEILVDGFSNHPKGAGGSFQEITFSELSLYKSGALEHFEIGSFVPGPISQYINFDSVLVYIKCETLRSESIMNKDVNKMRLALNGYQEIISKGSGAAVPHSLNNYVYTMQNFGGSILGLSEQERADFHDYGAKLLTYASTLPVDLQDANALSNLALLEIARKKYSQALQAVNSGITLLRDDRTGIPESLFGNSVPSENPWIKLELFATRAELIYRSGDVVKAKELAAKVLSEAQSIKYEGPDIKKVQWILAQR